MVIKTVKNSRLYNLIICDELRYHRPPYLINGNVIYAHRICPSIYCRPIFEYARRCELSEKGIGFKSLQENIDTTTSGGQLIFHIFGALAQFERELIRERTNAGLKAARVRGRMGGRPVQLNKQEIRKLKKHYDKGDLSVMEICKLFNITKPTLYRYLKNESQKQSKQKNDKKLHEQRRYL